MATTKKLLVRFDIGTKDPISGDFLIPRDEEGKTVMRGVKSGKIAEFGMMVYLGAEVKENDLFAKLVDSGAFISNVEQALILLRDYVNDLGALRIGNVVRIVPAQGETGSLTLEFVSNTPSSAEA